MEGVGEENEKEGLEYFHLMRFAFDLDDTPLSSQPEPNIL